MNQKEKKEKKEAIGRHIDLANGRFKDEDVDSLYNLTSNIDSYKGKSISSHSSSTGWCSDGKYTRDMTTTTQIVSDDDRIYVETRRDYHDDDGTSGSFSYYYRTAREILQFAGWLFE